MPAATGLVVEYAICDYSLGLARSPNAKENSNYCFVITICFGVSNYVSDISNL